MENPDQRQLLNVIQVLNQVVAAGLDRDSVCDLIAQRALELTAASGAVIELAEGDSMVYFKACGTAAASVGLRLDRKTSLSGLCVEMAAPLRSDDTQADPRVDAAACKRVGAASMVCVPLFHGTRAIGVLKVLSGQTHAFDDVHISSLALLASVVGSTMANAERFLQADHDSRHDPLTGLLNRRAYDAELAHEFSRAARFKQSLTLALLDLDGLKQVNDTFGRSHGDDVLKRAAKAICGALRTTDVCFRIGGDEFAVLLPETPLHDSATVLDRVRKAVSAVASGVGISIGAACAEDFPSPEELQVAADNKLYDVKAARRKQQA